MIRWYPDMAKKFSSRIYLEMFHTNKGKLQSTTQESEDKFKKGTFNW